MPEMELTPSDRLAPFWPLIPGIRWGTLTVGLVITAIRQVYELDVFIWGLVLLVGVVWFGILAPLRLHMQRRPVASAAKLVLLGGFLLRLATIFASEGVDRYRVAAGM